MKQPDMILSQEKVSSLLTGWKKNDEELFRKRMDESNVFSIRRLNMDSDLTIIHEWVNMDYTRQYWQLNGTIEMLRETYAAVQENPHVGSFIGCLNGNVVCQMDVYNPKYDVIGNYYNCHEGDLGIHLLLGPDKTTITNFSAKVVMAFAAWFFGFNHIQRLVTEPDKNNRASNWLLRRMKFVFMAELNLPEKTANLFGLNKYDFRMVPNEFL